MNGLGELLAVLATVMSLLVLAGGIAGFAFMLEGCYVLRRRRRTTPHDHAAALLKSPLLPDIAVLLAASEASPQLWEFVRRVFTLEYSNPEMVLVLEDPSQAALNDCIREFSLVPSGRPRHETLPTEPVRAIYEATGPHRLVVVHKGPGAEGDAYNAGVNATSCPVIALLDAEGEFSPWILLRLVRDMLERSETVVAVCGVVPTPPAATLWSRFAALEALRLWLGRSLAFAQLNGVAAWPGSAMIFQREAVVKAGGFGRGSMDLMLGQSAAAPGEKRGRAIFMPEADSHLRAPQSLAQLRRTVEQDQQAVKRAVLCPRATPLLRLSLAWERILRPGLEAGLYLVTIGVAFLGALTLPLLVLVLVATVLNGIMLSVTAVFLRELAEQKASRPGELAQLFGAGVVENLGFRQIRNLWLLGALARKQNRGQTA